MAPIGYTQCYKLWTIKVGEVQGEFAVRSKAIPSIVHFRKGKTQALYDVAFDIIELYRLENNMPSPAWKDYIMDDEKGVQNVINTVFIPCEYKFRQMYMYTYM